MPQPIDRVVFIVLDSVGIGALPDAGDYHDVGAATLPHIAEACGGLRLPTLERFGLGNIVSLTGVSPVSRPLASWGRMRELSRGKDTIAGHWEFMGIVLDRPFALFPAGFPPVIIDEFLALTGLPGVLGNVPASGTEIIARLGEEHLRSGWPIVYTSGDSVFQIAASEEVIPLKRLYEICETARGMCDRHAIGRVIARPFIGHPGGFVRTANRRDYPMKPPAPTVLDHLARAGVTVSALGKIENIYAGQGITRSRHTKSNADGMCQLREELAATRNGLIFINLVDFDMLYGHRNDAAGYGRALEEFDTGLDGLIPVLGPGDLLIVSADHGCDPTFPGTDHTREYVPLLAYRPGVPGVPLGCRQGFGDIGATIAAALGHPVTGPFSSFLPQIQA
ncbi:MAG TPA: phosphopentomutase [Candidatus Aminicenantes bacterium]|nr:phosphopentomutase [Candidatus Aminicenantes bacterium]